MSETSAGKTPYQRPPRPPGTRASMTASMVVFPILKLDRTRSLSPRCFHYSLALRPADAAPLARELRAQALRQIEDVSDFRQVILAFEQRPDLLQLDVVARAQRGVRLRDASPDDEAACARFEERLGNGLRLLTVERDAVRQSLFALAELRLQDAHAALVTTQLACDDRVGRLVLHGLLARHVPAVGRDQRALHREVCEDAEGAQLAPVLQLLRRAPARRVRLGVERLGVHPEIRVD